MTKESLRESIEKHFGKIPDPRVIKRSSHKDDRWSLEASKILEPKKNWEELGFFANGCSESSRERLLEGTRIQERAFNAFWRC